jgi:hypothetical protein
LQFQGIRLHRFDEIIEADMLHGGVVFCKSKKESSMVYVFIVLLIFFINTIHGQKQDEDLQKSYVMSGYLLTETFYETYQNFSSTDGFNAWYPLAPAYDTLGRNQNKHGEFNICVIESRIKGELQGPLIKDFLSKATVEVDIAGRNEILNLVRLRHAFYEIYDDSWHFTIGHTWHPLHTKPYVPCVISNNSGNPFETYGRKPQLRAAYKKDSLVGTVAVLAQDDHVSAGPAGNSSVYIRNGFTPELATVLQWIDDEGVSVGAGFRFKRIRPRILTEQNISVAESINSVAAMVYAGLENEIFHIASRLIYAQNGSDFNLIGGYAVCKTDPDTDERSYTTIDVVSCWVDCIYKGFQSFEVGAYTAYAHNFGARSSVDLEVSNPLYGVGTQIKNLFRLSPFLSYQKGPFKVALECEYTAAWHGLMQSDGSLKKNDQSDNIRVLCALLYYF